MPDLFYLLSKWKKQIAAVVLLSMAIVAAIYFIRPAKYLSVATALPANSYLADKSRVFSENIEALYSVLGTADELDMIIGTGQLDTVYLAITNTFDLTNHYKIPEKGDAAYYKAASLLKKNTKVQRSEYGELKIKVWDKDRILAAKIANAVLQKIQDIHSHLQNANNRTVLDNLVAGRAKIITQLATSPDSAAAVFNQLEQYDKLIAQYQLMADSKTNALLVVENARPAAWPDRPKFWQLILATFVAGLIFSLLTALVLERRKNTAV
jgi:capsular polysaccharide biosynthesis protein